MDVTDFARSRRSVTTPYGSIAYMERGTGPAAIFLHGFLMNGHVWRDVIDLLSTARRCIALELLGHGHTEVASEQDLSFDAQAGMIESVNDELGLDQIDLVGNDSGTGIAQIFAANHPERLRTLTLTNGDVHDNWPTPDLSNIIQLAKSGGAANVFRSLIADLGAGRLALAAGFEHPDQLSDHTIAAYLTPLVANEESGRSMQRFAETFENIQTVRVHAKLRVLHAPTLILWGTGDTFFDLKWAYWLKDTIPGALDVIEVPGAKLFFPAERPEFVADHLLKLWDARAMSG